MMMKSKFFCGLLFIFLFATISVNAQTDKSRIEIENANKKFVDAFAKNDSQSIANLYAENAKAFPPNGAIVEGRKNIQDFWKGARDSGISKFELTTTEFEKSGNTAYEVGNYTLFGSDGKAIDDGKYIVIWKKIGKNWFLYRDIWNSNRKN
jgi:ketosteroid isomerase-like protein